MPERDVDELLNANDPVLWPLIASESDDTRRAELETLLTRHALPVVRQVVSRQQSANGPLRAQDAEDIASTVTIRLVRKLQRVPFESGEAIERLTDFAASSTFNAVHDFMRRHFPERTRLKNRVRYVLLHDARFRTWAAPAGTVCGRASSPEMPAGQAPVSWSHADPSRPADAIDSLLGAAGGSMLVEDVIQALAEAWKVVDAPADTGTEATDLGPSQAMRLESRHRLEALWRETCALPKAQRAALLLNLRDVDGGNAAGLFVLMGIASLDEVAAAIDLPPRRLATLWPRLPLDDLTLASVLGVTRQQVINLRLAARQRLARRMKKW